MTVTITLVSNYDAELAELEMQATEFKKAKDWNSAIECLQKARLWRGTGTDRLPLFLQQAGRFDEAMAEFNLLLDEVDANCMAMFGHQPDFIQQGQSLHMRAAIYDKMRLACQREKRIVEAKQYATISDDFSKRSLEYRALAEQHRKQKAG